MFGKFGEFNSAEEINRKAEELFNMQDLDGIRALAAENGIPHEYAQAYCEGDLPELCDRLTAAVKPFDYHAFKEQWHSFCKRLSQRLVEEDQDTKSKINTLMLKLYLHKNF